MAFSSFANAVRPIAFTVAPGATIATEFGLTVDAAPTSRSLTGAETNGVNGTSVATVMMIAIAVMIGRLIDRT